MGMYNLIFFMSGAFGSAIVGKVLDYSQTSLAINPFVSIPSASIYSNIFISFVIIISVAITVFYTTFQTIQTKFREERSRK